MSLKDALAGVVGDGIVRRVGRRGTGRTVTRENEPERGVPIRSKDHVNPTRDYRPPFRLYSFRFVLHMY